MSIPDGGFQAIITVGRLRHWTKELSSAIVSNRSGSEGQGS